MDRAALAMLLVGLAAGFTGGWLVADLTSAPTAAFDATRAPQGTEASGGPLVPAPADGPTIAVTKRPRTDPSPQPPAGPGTPAPGPPAPATPPLTRDMEARVAEVAAGIRARALRSHDEAERSARALVERQLAEERDRLADLERGGPLKLLKALYDTWVAPHELVGTPERFAALFERKTRGARVDARGTDASTRVEDGDVLDVPAGVWPFDTRAFNLRARGTDGFPRDVLIEGAGMDRSLLVLNDEFDATHDVHSLTLRDLTVHCNRNYLAQLRRAFTLRLDRVRVVGFDSAGGGSCAIAGSVGAVYATDCRFENGFPDDRGGLLDVRGAFVGRFERCTFDDLDDLYGRHRSLALFERCAFPYVSKHHARQFESPREGARFLDCTITVLDPAQASAHKQKRRRRSVAEFNPDWKMPERWR